MIAAPALVRWHCRSCGAVLLLEEADWRARYCGQAECLACRRGSACRP